MERRRAGPGVEDAVGGRPVSPVRAPTDPRATASRRPAHPEGSPSSFPEAPGRAVESETGRHEHGEAAGARGRPAARGDGQSRPQGDAAVAPDRRPLAHTAHDAASER